MWTAYIKWYGSSFLAPLVTATLLCRMPARLGAVVAAPVIASLALLSYWQIELWKSEDRLCANTRSMSRGISPDRSLAV